MLGEMGKQQRQGKASVVGIFRPFEHLKSLIYMKMS